MGETNKPEGGMQDSEQGLDTAGQLRRTTRLLDCIRKAQQKYIQSMPVREVFGMLLEDILALTGSAYGFIGEVHHTSSGTPYLKTHAITDISWDAETEALYRENEREGFRFENPATLFGAVLTTGEPVIANHPASDPRSGGLPNGHPPLDSFMALPFHAGSAMVGMVGMANRPGGYTQEDIEYLMPFVSVCASIITARRAEEARSQAEASLVQNNKFLRVMMDAVAEPIMVINTDYSLRLINRAAMKFGLLSEDQEDPSRTLYCYQVSHGRTEPCQSAEHPCPLRVVVETREPTVVMHKHRSAQGEDRHVEVMASPLHDADGRLIGIVETNRDLTPQVLAREALEGSLKEKDLLLREVHHRVKNNMQLISSMLRLQERYMVHDADRLMFEQSQMRIRTMALVHEQLYGSGDLMRIDLDHYTRRIFSILAQTTRMAGNVSLDLQMGNVTVDIETAIPLGMVINELLDNSLRHAFGDGRQGVVRAELTGHGAPGAYRLVISDNGSGMPDADPSLTVASMGMTLVESLTRQLGGALSIESGPGGTSVTVTFSEQAYDRRF
jgi:two-component sensor histidine kinase